MQARAGGKRQVSLVRLIELAPPPERSTLRTAPEPLERADINRLQFDPNSADDVHLVERSPKPAERRGTSGHLPPADLIERQLRSSRGSGGRDRPGPTTHQPSPPVTSSVQANRIPQLDEAVITTAKAELSREIVPIDDIRSTKDYRVRVSVNVLEDFLRQLITP